MKFQLWFQNLCQLFQICIGGKLATSVKMGKRRDSSGLSLATPVSSTTTSRCTGYNQNFTAAAAALNFVPAARGYHCSLPVTSELRREVVRLPLFAASASMAVAVVMVVVAPVSPAEPHVLTVTAPASNGKQETLVVKTSGQFRNSLLEGFHILSLSFMSSSEGEGVMEKMKT